MTEPAKVVSAVSSVLAALSVRVERADDGHVKRVTILGLPVFDETFRGVQRRRARRAARRKGEL